MNIGPDKDYHNGKYWHITKIKATKQWSRSASPSTKKSQCLLTKQLVSQRLIHLYLSPVGGWPSTTSRENLTVSHCSLFGIQIAWFSWLLHRHVKVLIISKGTQQCNFEDKQCHCKRHFSEIGFLVCSHWCINKMKYIHLNCTVKYDFKHVKLHISMCAWCELIYVYITVLSICLQLSTFDR